MKPKGWFSRRHQTSEQHVAAIRDSKGDRKARADERVGKATGSDLGLKVKVKSGELTPYDAYELLIASADDQDQAALSRTARWLMSPNAAKRYHKALKTKNKKS